MLAPHINDTIKDLSGITFLTRWNEMPHEALTLIKAQIEPLEANHVWETLKKKTNPYELIYTQENTECPASVSLIKPLSRSYFKMIEMMSALQFFDRLPKSVQKIRSAHVAEGPGGFIEALLDQTVYRRIHAAKVTAMTLKPTNNHVPGWRRTFSYLQKHPEIKIHYGEDGTGDLYNVANQNSFVNLCDQQKVNIFTGDGGFDFSVDYEHQEKSVFRLLVSSAIIGLRVLNVEGSFILKFFDIFSESTHILIRLITICFKEWTLYKPATSRPCNSERYLLCRGFKRCPPEVMKLLLMIQEQYSQNEFYPQMIDQTRTPFPFFTEKEKDFLNRHIKSHNDTQISTLQQTIELTKTTAAPFSWAPHYIYAKAWCSYFRIPIKT